MVRKPTWAGDRLYVLASVPGGPSGPFYDTFRKGGRLWRLFHTSAEQSRLVSPTWTEERREEWGEGSPVFQARVLGEFPEEAEGTLIPLSDLEAAQERVLEEEGDAPVLIGVDPARFGPDRTALAVWEGNRLVKVQTRQGLDTMETAAWVASEINRRHAKSVRVDEIGLGSGVVDRLHQLGYEVEGVNVARAAERPDVFANVRAELFWRLGEALQRGEVSIPRNDRLTAELSALRYEITATGKIRLEPKEQTKKRVGRSPDLADAVALGFAVPVWVEPYYEEVDGLWL